MEVCSLCPKIQRDHWKQIRTTLCEARGSHSSAHEHSSIQGQWCLVSSDSKQSTVLWTAYTLTMEEAHSSKTFYQLKRCHDLSLHVNADFTKCCTEMNSLEDGTSNWTELCKFQVGWSLLLCNKNRKEKKSITKLLVTPLYSQIDIMLHQPHSCISWPTLLIVVTNNVFIVWVWMFCEVPLNQISGFFSSKPVQ